MVNLITDFILIMFILGVYDISGVRKTAISYFDKKSFPTLRKLSACLFCQCFWLSVLLVLVNYCVFNNLDTIWHPIYIGGFMYFIIKLRWK